MKLNILKFCIFGLLMALSLDAESKDPAPVRDITLIYSDTVVKTAVWNASATRGVHLDRNYFWFYNNTISHNIGGYSGKLLHGKYEVFDKGKRLLCSGEFEHGLREGEWITWFRNGQIKDYTDYKKGKIHGIRKTYDPSGNLLSDIKYRKNLQDGISHYYRPDTVLRVKYRNGVTVDPGRKRLNILSFVKRHQEKPEKPEGKRKSRKDETEDQK